jgi:hypothetical protein
MIDMKKIKNIILLIICMISGCAEILVAQSPVNPVKQNTNATYLEPTTNNMWGSVGNGATLQWRQWVDSVQMKRNLANSTSITTTVAGLRAITNPQATVIYQTKDFGGGNWYWNATDTRADNTGTIIKPTSITTGRFNRIYSGKINVLWFGADSTNTVSVHTYIAAAQAWAHSLSGGGEVYLPTGRYKTTSTIPIPYPNVTLSGDGMGSLIIPAFTTDSTILVSTIRGNPQTDYLGTKRIGNINIRNIGIDCSNLPNIMPNGVRILTPSWYGWVNSVVSLAGVDNGEISNVYIKNAKNGGVVLLMSYNIKVSNTTVDGLVTSAPTSALVYNGNAFSFAGSNLSGITYTGPIGNYIIDKCIATGTLGTWPGALIGTNIVGSGNIGFQFAMGSYNATGPKSSGAIMTNCIASKFIYGAMNEGEAAGSGKIIISSNDFTLNYYGFANFGETSFLNISKDLQFIGNRIAETYYTPIVIYGSNQLIANNKMHNWGIAKKTANTPLSFALNAVNAAIYYNPFANGDNVSVLTVNGSEIANNMAENTYKNDTSYRAPIAGIVAIITSPYQVDLNTKIIGNVLNADSTTNNPGGTNFASGIFVQGQFQHLDINDNTITGFNEFGIGVQPVNSDQTTSPKYVTMRNNIVHDNGWNNSNLREINIYSGNPHYTIEHNSLYETGGSRMANAISVQASTGGASAMDYLRISSTTAYGYAFGDVDMMAINVSGTHVYIEDNDLYNNRTTPPSSSTYKVYQGTKFWNTNPSTGILGWVNTVTGNPGTFAPFYNQTGEDARYQSILDQNVNTTGNPFWANVYAQTLNLRGTSTNNMGWQNPGSANYILQVPTALPSVNGQLMAFTTGGVGSFITPGTLTSITPGVLFTSHTPITSSGTMDIDSAAISAKYVKLTTNQTIFGAKVFQANGIATTNTPLVILNNTTAATSGATQQNSPVMQFGAHGWNNSTLADNTSDWYVGNEVSQGNPVNSALTFRYSSNGGTKTQLLSLGSAGDLNMSASGRLLTSEVSAISTGSTLNLQKRGQTGSSAAIIASSGTFSGGAGINQVAFAITPVGTQTSTAGMTHLLVNPSGTWGSGTHLLADFQLSNVSKWKVDNTGQMTSASLTASTALVSDASKNIVSSSTTAAQIGYLGTTTSDVQSQLNGKLSTTGSAAGLTGLTSGQVTTALGFTPYNSTNPSSYMTNPMTSQGDIIYGGVSGVATRLAPGGTNMVLFGGNGSTPPSWKLPGNQPLQYLHVIFTPTTGSSSTLIVGYYNIINPATAIAALTINMPASPVDGDVVIMDFTKAITAITYTGGTVSDGAVSSSAGSFQMLVYDSGTNTWY